MFFSTQIQTFGLDISDQSIKIAQIVKKRAGLQLAGLNKTNLPENILVNGEIQDEEKLIKYIKKTIADCRPEIKNNYAVLCLPEVKTFIKLITIKLADSKISNNTAIKNLIQKYLPKHIPMPIEEIYFDWQIVNQKNDEIEVLIGIAPKETVASFSNLAKKCGLMPIAFEIEAGSILRSIFTTDDHFLSTPSTFKLKHLQNILKKIDFKIKKINLTKKQDFQKPKKVTTNKTVYFIVDCGALRSGLITWADGTIKFTTTLKPLTHELANEIAVAKEFYEKSFSSDQTNYEIILSGGSANLKGMNKELENLLKIRVSIADPLINLIKNNQQDKINLKEIQSYTTAIGLALRSFLVKDY